MRHNSHKTVYFTSVPNNSQSPAHPEGRWWLTTLSWIAGFRVKHFLNAYCVPATVHALSHAPLLVNHLLDSFNIWSNSQFYVITFLTPTILHHHWIIYSWKGVGMGNHSTSEIFKFNIQFWHNLFLKHHHSPTSSCTCKT